MAQFDIHRNPSPRSGTSRPFIIVIQSSRFDRLATRLVAALAQASALPRGDLEGSHLTPSFRVQDRTVFLNPFELTNLLAERLGPCVASLADDDDAKRRIQKALDEVLSHY